MKTLNKNIYQITGLGCNACAVSVENILKQQSEVVNATVDFDNKTVAIETTNPTATIKTWQAALIPAGYNLK